MSKDTQDLLKNNSEIGGYNDNNYFKYYSGSIWNNRNGKYLSNGPMKGKKTDKKSGD
jgi:hypothetical protein